MAQFVAYSGERGAFAEQACQVFLPDHEPVPVPSFADVARQVSAGAIRSGMLPVRNSRIGAVPGIAELIRTHDLEIWEHHRLPINLHLLGRSDARLEDLDAVESHPAALAQCRETLLRLGLKQLRGSNTAAAALRLAAGGDRNRKRGVIASEVAASIYGLKIILRNVQDDPANTTTFAVVRRKS